MLRTEAIRLALQPEPSHEHRYTKGITAASTDGRGHAPAQARRQDPERLHPCRAAFCRLAAALAGYGERRGSASLSAALRGSRRLAHHAQRHDHGTEVLFRSDDKPSRVDEEDAPLAPAPSPPRDFTPPCSEAPDPACPPPPATL